ncbi:TFIIH subunit Tfb4/p34 [Filobasidium floriforme]|uniref:TFIIH subunit Tfb4/p34 n=1 Tax=Filobasidium floriforme TaxID=5210 RepID=UPI001E8CF9B5|nr:TFIIH subunit Tfb4/p34 [Filobasidium floriforme]KAH8089259.1 TFIIH subunit Tfb4/p34 [Filobasidium floriforme]
MDELPSVLVAILDIHPLSWSREAQLAQAKPTNDNGGPSTDTALPDTALYLSIDRALDQLLVFFNSHLAMRWGNELVLFVAMANGKSELLYSSQAPSVSLQHDLDANSFEPFHSMGETISSRLRQLLVKQMETHEEDDVDMDEEAKTKLDGPAIVPALLRALCHINRIHPVDSQGVQNIQSSTTGHYVLDEHETKARARIMVINNSHDRGNGGYVGLMNAVFAAQKRKIPMDILNLHPEDSIFLQQASHLTHGIYYRVRRKDGLLQYLNLIFLASPDTRKQLGLPSQDKVDFRAVCFCHHRVVDVGFVCSVCLSIFCEPKPLCSTCKSRFPMQSVLQLKKSLPAALIQSITASRPNQTVVPSPLAG